MLGCLALALGLPLLGRALVNIPLPAEDQVPLYSSSISQNSVDQFEPLLDFRPTLQEVVEPVLKTLSKERLKEDLVTFTTVFTTRHYLSSEGRRSQKWLLSTIQNIVRPYSKPWVHVTEFKHPWGTNSILVTLDGSEYEDDRRRVIIGGHHDSMNVRDGLVAPVVVLLETLRAVLGSGFRPERTTEIHWYAAEEAGYLGSTAVVSDYRSKGNEVLGMACYDTLAWIKEGTEPTIPIMINEKDPLLPIIHKILVDEYLDTAWVDHNFTDVESDDFTWKRAGYRSTLLMESVFSVANKANLHSSRDRHDISDEFSFEHMLEFAKLATAYLLELGIFKK